MADPISLASGLITLVGFALQCSKSLYQAVETFQSHQRTIRDLRDELQSLNGVLQSLHEVADSPNTSLSSLKCPLLQCGKTCKGFEDVITKCTPRSEARTSFRDWAKLRYMGGDIDSFRHMLAGYKSTITIALGDANIRTAAVTATVLTEYKQLIEETKSDLEEHLRDIDGKLEALASQTIGAPEFTIEQRRIQDERVSAKQCLQICADVAAFIDQVQPRAPSNASPTSEEPNRPTIAISAHHITTGALGGCRTTLATANSQLQAHLDELEVRLRKMALPSGLPGDSADELNLIRDEMDSIKQCLAICTRASEQATQHRTVFVEDVSSADDGHQVIVATLGDLISVKHVKAGARTAQWLGQMSDKSLQQLSRDRVQPRTEGQRDGPGGPDAEFRGRYGAGHSLAPTGDTMEYDGACG